MATTNYLDLNINKLFEQHTIKEIEEIQKKIQLESDRKKVELRTLVGERYRDLILAADTIGKMKVTSERLISRLAGIEDKFRELQKKYLIGFKIAPEERKTDRSEEMLDSVIIQIKLLMDIPEHIWSAIDKQDLLLATQLFMVAQHINYSLTFEVGHVELTNNYPIVSKQWDIISQFKNVILNECNKILQLLEVSSENAANCLASLVVLNGTTASGLLEKLISTRTEAVKTVILKDSDSNVKTRIKSCIRVMNQTISLIHSCFKNHNNMEQGLVLHYITNIKDLETYTLISQFELNNELIERYLPSVTKNHKPFTLDVAEDFSSLDIEKDVKAWMDWVKGFCNTEITKLLELIVSVKGLYSIREEIVNIDLPQNWDEIWEELSVPKINFWIEFFQPLLTQRVKSIINDKWTETCAELKSEVTELLDKLTHEKYEYPEHDLRWFVWKDSPADIPQKLTKNGEMDEKRPLLMKSKGFSPNLVRLCESLDRNLSSLLSDLEQYLYETERSTSLKNNSLPTSALLIPNTFSDRSEIHDHLRNVSSSALLDFVEFVKNECVCDEPKRGNRSTNAIVLARFLMATTSICPNLTKCFASSKPSGLTVIDAQWQSVCDHLKSQSTSVWSIWAKMYRSRLSERRIKFLTKEPRQRTLPFLHSVSEWERVIVEEEAAEGNKVKSEILVPYQPSIPLQKFLNAVNADLNKIIPHTIPKKVLHEIIEDVATESLDYYWDVSQNVNLRQKQAFQVLFDTKYVSLLMIPRENKLLSEKSSKTSESVLTKIDPFDYDLFSPFINSNLKKSVQRSLLTLGNLVPHLEQVHSILGGRSEQNEGAKLDSPALLALCTGAPWFPPLAVTVPSRNLPLLASAMPEKPQITRKKIVTKDHSVNDSTNTVKKSGAAAFFGAMGSDWFGTT